jgi:hypothetical protein
VRARKSNAPWHTAAGVRIGNTLPELERLAGAPVTFSGFGWDFGGGASWEEEGGRMGLRLSIDPASNELLSDLSNRDPRTNDLFGDRAVRSDHPIAQQLRIVVEEMVFNWGPVADEHDCG